MAYSKARRGTDKRVVRTKRAIRTALFEIIETKDISSVTVSELARKAGVNRRTFYTHYVSITEIVDEIEEELVEALRTIVINFNENNFQEVIYDVFIKLNDIVTEDFDFYFRHLKMDIQGAFVGRINEIIDELSGKIVKSLTDIPFERAKLAATFAVGGFITAFFDWKNRKTLSLEETAKIVSAASEGCIKEIYTSRF